jgi:hypothetical protein
MIQYTSNINLVVGGLTSKLKELQNNPDQMLRTVALTLLPEVKKRVHVDGKDSNGNQIGTYSKAYMVLRTGAYQNAKRVTRGNNKGKLKDAGSFTDRTIRLDKKTGVFSGEDKVGQARPKYNRTSDPKVILSLTRQMENDLSVLPIGGGYGIGYNNPDNFKKSQYNEATYKKRIWAPTEDEKALVRKTAEAYVKLIVE